MNENNLSACNTLDVSMQVELPWASLLKCRARSGGVSLRRFPSLMIYSACQECDEDTAPALLIHDTCNRALCLMCAPEGSHECYHQSPPRLRNTPVWMRQDYPAECTTLQSAILDRFFKTMVSDRVATQLANDLRHNTGY